MTTTIGFSSLRLVFAGVIGAAALALGGQQANAATIQFDYNIEFSGATPPAGTPPWLTAVFDDGGGSGSVTLTMSTPGLVGSEFVSSWFFNLDPSLDPSSLVFAHAGGTEGPADSITQGTNCCKADGDGFYDFRLDVSGFNAGETLVYTISLAGITASSFDFLSLPAGGSGPFNSAAHVQSIGPGGEESGWVANSNGSVVPVPAAVWLFGSGLGLLALARRRVA